jgi:REP element-mobilizing transposase RayT
MYLYKVKAGDAVWFDEEASAKITMYIRNCIKKYRIWCPAYNVCGDHVHIILVCRAEKLASTVRMLKSVSAREYNMATGVTKIGEKGGTTQNHLWARRFNHTIIRTKKQFDQTIAYIKQNREKHGLPPLDLLTKGLIRDMISEDIPEF